MAKVLNAPCAYELCQILRNPRDGAEWLYARDEYRTLEDALKDAKKDLKGAPYVIIEKRVVYKQD